MNRLPSPVFMGFPGGPDSKEYTCNVGDLGSISGLGRFPWMLDRRMGSDVSHSSILAWRIPMDRGVGQKLPAWERLCPFRRQWLGAQNLPAHLSAAALQAFERVFRRVTCPRATEVGGGMQLGFQVSLKWVVLELVFELPLRSLKRAVTHHLF